MVVMVQDEETARFSLGADGIYDINGGTNTIEIKDMIMARAISIPI